MVDLSAISTALAALKGAKDIAESMVGLRDAAAFQAKLIEFQSKIIDANNASFAAQDERTVLLETITELKKQVTYLEAWEAEKQRYKLTDLGDGSLAYVLKEDASRSEPPHQICTNCYEERHKSILQKHTTDVGRWQVFACPRCGLELYPFGGGPQSGSKTRRKH